MKFYINIREEIISLTHRVNEINNKNGTDYFNEHLYNQLDRFDKMVYLLNSYNMIVSDEDFKRLMALDSIDVNVDWIIKYMYIYKTRLIDTIITYMACHRN